MSHFIEFFFLPAHEVWYRGAVWGNVAAIIPCGIVAFLWLRSRHLAIQASHQALHAAHADHARKLDELLDRMDPDTDGGLQEIRDRLDPETPGGITVLRDDLRSLK